MRFVLEIMERRTTQEALVSGDAILIGRTALRQLGLHVDRQQQRLVPNPSELDRRVCLVT